MNAIPAFSTTTTRHDGWSPELCARFLALLAESGNVRLCARRCQRSAQSAYVLKRRDPVFAQGWAAALLLARDQVEQALADRALEGVEEPIFYRGEQVGTRRRYDNRLLLVHLARLDRLAEDEEAQVTAARFDELLAVVAGEEPPAGAREAEDGPWPLDREDFVEEAATAADRAVFEAYREDPARFHVDGAEDCDRALAEAHTAARRTAGAEWDAWFARACARADAVREADQAPIEFKSLDPVNIVNFGGQPRRDRPCGGRARPAAYR